MKKWWKNNEQLLDVMEKMQENKQRERIIMDALFASQKITFRKVFSGKYKIKKTCKVWCGYVDKKGYGRLTLNYKTWYAHQLAYILGKRELPIKGMVVVQYCDNTACINPDHLYLADHSSRKEYASDELRSKIKHEVSCGFSPDDIAESHKLSCGFVEYILKV